jgi:hypothetical protein
MQKILTDTITDLPRVTDLLVLNIKIDTYERHRFARSMLRSRSTVKVVCVLVAKLKKIIYKALFNHC